MSAESQLPKDEDDFKSPSISSKPLPKIRSSNKRPVEEEEEKQKTGKKGSTQNQKESVQAGLTKWVEENMPGPSNSSTPKAENVELANPGRRYPLTALIKDNITSKDLERLEENGLCTVEAVAQTSTRRLCKIKGISENKASLLIKHAKRLSPTGYTTAGDLFEKRADVIYITSGSSALDTLLHGGFETGSMTEIFGESRSGKTQICYTLAVTCQLPVDMGGAEGKCLFIDSEDTFRPERVVGIADRFKLNLQDTLENISHARAFNCEQLMELLVTGSAMLSEDKYALVVVDSATSLFRSEYCGRGELQERQTHLGQFLRTLRRLCDEYGVAVVYTNQVVADVGSMSLFQANAIKPIGGNIMSHASNTRLSIRKGRGETRICKVYSSPTIPESEAPFAITSGGITNVQQE